MNRQRPTVPDLAVSALRILPLLAICIVFPVDELAADEPRHGLCNDYGSKTDYSGNRYYVRDPETGRVVRQHWGMDFCTRTGADVLAAADGTITWIIWDNPVRGGAVAIQSVLHGADGERDTVHIRHLHIDPDPRLREGMAVRAGMVIGKTQKGGKQQIGPRSHVHFDMGKCRDMWLCPVSPHPYWRDGKGKVSCFDPAKPTAHKLVAPVACRSD